MNLAMSARHLIAVFATAVMVAAATPSMAADEIAASHLKAARSAISALKATEEFDQILPQAALALKSELTQKNPDLSDLISNTVDDQAVKLAIRRADLEAEAAKIYARVFTEQELNEISTFYNTATGKKLLDDGNIVGREVLQAAGLWQRGIARDLGQAVAEQLQAVMSAQAPAAQQQPAQPAGGTQPAGDAQSGGQPQANK